MRPFYALVVGLILGCGSAFPSIQTAKSQAFEEDLEDCRDRAVTCDQFVACQHDAQRKAGYPLSGSCQGQALVDLVEDDGGLDDGGRE